MYFFRLHFLHYNLILNLKLKQKSTIHKNKETTQKPIKRKKNQLTTLTIQTKINKNPQ